MKKSNLMYAMVSSAVIFSGLCLAQQSKPLVVVKPFSVVSTLRWPYDAVQLQAQIVAQLSFKATRFQVSTEIPVDAAPVYTLQGEVLAWRPGNKAKRVMVGMGAGREAAEVHYYLTDASGKHVFDSTDTIRAALWTNAYGSSVGQLAQPLADKIAKRLNEAKLF